MDRRREMQAKEELKVVNEENPTVSTSMDLPPIPNSQMRYESAKKIYGEEIKNRWSSIKRKDIKNAPLYAKV